MQPVVAADRHVSLDVLRGAALPGVLLVNLLSGFRVSLFAHILSFHTHAGWANRATDIREKALGVGHADVARSLENLAAACYRQKRYVESESLYRRALVILEKSLGPKHPEFAASLAKYARTLRRLKKDDETTKVDGRINALSPGSN